MFLKCEPKTWTKSERHKNTPPWQRKVYLKLLQIKSKFLQQTELKTWTIFKSIFYYNSLKRNMFQNTHLIRISEGIHLNSTQHQRIPQKLYSMAKGGSNMTSFIKLFMGKSKSFLWEKAFFSWENKLRYFLG